MTIDEIMFWYAAILFVLIVVMTIYQGGMK